MAVVAKMPITAGVGWKMKKKSQITQNKIIGVDYLLCFICEVRYRPNVVVISIVNDFQTQTWLKAMVTVTMPCLTKSLPIYIRSIWHSVRHKYFIFVDEPANFTLINCYSSCCRTI